MPVFAAEIFLEPDKNPGQEDQFKVDIFLSTEEQLNAIEGTLHFPLDLLELKSVDDGNSIINFWVERPNVISNGDIRFSGITPGGYTGSRGLIFSITFKVLQEGNGVFDIRDSRVLRNDGKGTEAKLQTINSPFIISKKTVVFQVPVSETKDIDSPESFVPEIARDSTIFDGKWFLVFSTQDKATGIDHYEVKEIRKNILQIFAPWVPAESPYVLQDQELRSHVFVKAVDKAGNMKIEDIPAKNPLRWYENYGNWFILVLGFIAIFAARKFLWKKSTKI
ncbi:MAG: cohesin domain-containing protein [bacterium]|nr:cohesin domain-containing protein [bacterium]